RLPLGKPEAHRERNPLPLDLAGFPQQLPDSLGQSLGLRQVEIRERRGEFVAAQASGDVAGADTISQRLAESADGAVAGMMPERVVDRLQVVEVEESDRERTARPLSAGDVALERALEFLPVRQSGQEIRPCF